MYEEKNTDLNSRFFLFSLFVFFFFQQYTRVPERKTLNSRTFFGIVMQISIRGVRYPSKEIMIIIIGETQWACIHLIWFRLRGNGYKVVSSATGPQLDIRAMNNHKIAKEKYHIFEALRMSSFLIYGVYFGMFSCVCLAA